MKVCKLSSDIQEKIDLYYNSLSKGHKKIADFIRSDYEKASFMTASELGQAVGTSESTVVRFAAHIGFAGYPELQKNLQETVKSRLTSVQRMEAANRIYGGDFVEAALNTDIEMIKKTLDGLDRSAFAGAVEAINNAKKIYILGVRSSASIASFAAFYLGFIYDAVFIDTSASNEIFEKMLRIDKDDVCIAISFPRYSNRTLKALKFARSRGAEIISVTDSEISPIAAYADYLLLAQSSMLSFVDSLVAPMSLLSALIAASAGERKEEIHAKLEELEKIWEEYRVYRVHGEDQP